MKDICQPDEAEVDAMIKTEGSKFVCPRKQIIYTTCYTSMYTHTRFYLFKEPFLA